MLKRHIQVIVQLLSINHLKSLELMIPIHSHLYLFQSQIGLTKISPHLNTNEEFLIFLIIMLQLSYFGQQCIHLFQRYHHQHACIIGQGHIDTQVIWQEMVEKHITCDMADWMTHTNDEKMCYHANKNRRQGN